MTRRQRRLAHAIVAAIALSYLALMAYTGALPERRHRIEFEAEGVLSQTPDTIDGVVMVKARRELRFRRDADGWTSEADRKPLPPTAASTLARAVKFMHTATPVRVFDRNDLNRSSLTEFGLDEPRFTVTLLTKGSTILEAQFGDMNADGFLQYMSVTGRDQLFLMSRFVGAEWSAVASSANTRSRANAE